MKDLSPRVKQDIEDAIENANLKERAEISRSLIKLLFFAVLGSIIFKRRPEAQSGKK